MDTNIWELVRQERESLAELGSTLTEGQWGTQSLCTEWTVREVFAHTVMTPAGEPRPWPMARALLRARGHLWTAGRDVAAAYAVRPTDELVSSMRRMAGARTKPLFVVDENILLDLVVHGQDMAVPLGMDRPVPAQAARTALDRAWSMGWPFHARRRLAGVRLRSEDGAGWEAGEGPEVSGTSGALALLLTARTQAALPLLHGPGVATLAGRFQSPGA